MFSAGIHPWAVGHVDVKVGLEYLKTAPIVAVGEIGLDHFTDAPLDRQEEIFRAQLAIAQQRNLPVVIHCVHAYNEALPILKDYDLKAVIFHGYIGSPEQTEIILRAGYYLSLDERSLLSPRTKQSLKQARPDRIFAETDDSEMHVSEIYDHIAGLRGVTLEKLRTTIGDNFNRIFG